MNPFTCCTLAVLSRAQTAFFLLCWGRERKGLVDLRMWFCVTANTQNLGVILIYRVYLYLYSTRIRVKLKTPRFWAFAVTQNHIRRSTRPYPNTKERKWSGHETTLAVKGSVLLLSEVVVDNLLEPSSCFDVFAVPDFSENENTFWKSW